MPYILGVLLGSVLLQINVLRAARAALVLALAGYVAYRIADQHVSHRIAVVAGFAVPLAVFVWSACNPAASRWRLRIFEGVYLLVRFAMLILIFCMAVSLFLDQFQVGRWLTSIAPWAAIAVALWGLQRLFDRLLDRSNRRMDERTMVACPNVAVGEI